VLEADRLTDKENMPAALYNHIWLGHPNDTVDNAIIPTEWFDAAIDAHLKLGFAGQGARICAHDPSDTGPDAKAVGIRHGSIIEDVQEKTTGDVNEGCDWATDYAIERQCDLFTWDCDGMGVSLRRQVGRAFSGKRIDYVMFKGSEGVDNPRATFQSDGARGRDRNRTNAEALKNKRSQYYWALRDRFFNTYQAVVHKKYIDPDKMISLSSEIENMEQLRSEVCRIPLKPNGNGVIQIMTKQEMAKKPLCIPSPNMSDVLMMLMVPPKTDVLTEDTQDAWDPFDPTVGY
jgi:phage terminase large subunit